MAEGTLTPPEFLEDTETGEQTAQGSVFINGLSSYSGADIKVVVHVYDNGSTKKARIANLKKEQITLEKQRDILIKTIDTSNSTIDSLTALNQRNALQGQIAFVEDEIDRLSKDTSGFSTKVLAELQTLSISTHREKYPVRALGAVYPKSYVRGARSIAGSMIFTVFNKHVLEEFLESHPSDFDAYVGATSALLDQIPPFDITVVFANETGQLSRMTIYGCEFVNEGQTMSIEDILLENTVQYVARDIDPMRAIAKRKIDENNRVSQEYLPIRGSDLLKNEKYQKLKQAADPLLRNKLRNNPFR